MNVRDVRLIRGKQSCERKDEKGWTEQTENMMKYIQIFLLGGYLLILAIEDIRRKKVPIWALGTALAVSPLFWIFREEGIDTFLLGIIPGAALIFVSFVSRGGIGLADAVIIVILGMNLGLTAVIMTVIVSFGLIALFSGGMLIAGRLRLKSTLPYIPFAFLGYVVTVIGT